MIGNRKGVNLPGKKIDAPSLIDADLKQLDMAALNTVDYVALSFARNKEDIDALRKEMRKRNIVSKIIVKVENQLAIDNIDELIEAGDGIMVARGDLGVEVPIEQLAYLQRMLVEKSRKAHKPVITATEMLHSMVGKPRPTRAEATDVSNAVFYGTDAVMLSAETASGDYPVESVEIMARIAAFTESVKPFEITRKVVEDKTQLIAMAAMEMIVNEGIQVDKIVVLTQTGYTSRVISSFRPKVPIIAVTNDRKTVESLTLSYGVVGFQTRFPSGKIISPQFIIDQLKEKKLVGKKETILVIHGARWKEPGLTNSITLVTS
jgi:pyruvate kinase